MATIRGHKVSPALVVIDVQNGFVSKGGSYDLLGMETAHYQQVIPRIAKLISLCRDAGVPVFYTQAVREKSGIDLLTRSHKILPKAREERIRRRPICVRDTWDAGIVDAIKPAPEDHIVIKRRDSAFHDTEIGVWLKSLDVDTLLFCGIDTSICVETSLRDAFNNGYDVVLVSDATASGNRKHFESTLEIVKDYYGFVMDIDELERSLLASQKQVQQKRVASNDDDSNHQKIVQG
ncbi:nicotinamidase-like amidase [Candidatus Nitrososphaera evergladensis SR1]|jgi:ureidoacrylate peracid hydrolase|uniref:Nicotinamidase-like amidase n=1 Tax=Candidatus Nitrososphaera evergladensis SR1 TaxID=1459636 RepID=A0A075MP27_9ARCH|nr:isochorismatase family cysteine hydrolase [Candidatus Nitrososphaera evergladensis]AIF82920.1 nicotinamidase-like amidase [Candidatus Nitrososphaera evergladensis SR1]